MNPIVQSLFTRKSVRVFTETPIPEEVKQEILLAATQAATAGNQQLYTILDITDQVLKDQLAVTCDDQPFIAKAPLVLIFCADPLKWVAAYTAAGCTPRPLGKGDLMLAVTDAAIAAQNAVVAAWSYGIGSCYIGDIMERCAEHRAMLQLPNEVFPAAMLVFGYPTTQQLERKKPERSALCHIVHPNAYRRMDAAELAQMLNPQTNGKDHDAWVQAFCKRKYNSAFAREMSYSVDAYLLAYPDMQPDEG